ncbi:ankyrin repeat domain-containing protein 26 isoform X20 [Oryzias latipes]
MKKIFNFTKKKKHGTPDNGSVLSAGYDLKDKDLGKIHKAALQADLAKLRQLVKKNDINQLDKDNRTALHIACASGHVEVVQFLVENKAKLNLCDNQNRSALMKAVQGQHERCVSILLENHAEPNVVDVNGNTALHLAANIPSISTAVLLLQHGAEIDAQNKEGFTPLAVAVREDHIEMAEFLLKESSDVNSVDQDQRSLLMLAAGNGQISMVKLLLHFDADITLKDAKGLLADNYAAMNGHHPCSLLIIEHGTQKTNGASASQRGQKTKKRTTLASSSHDVEAGFSLGGPAIDKEEHGANEAGGDFEDNSQSESLSRLSKSAADEWPSSEEEDESALVDKRGLKVNLSKMIESKKGKASVLLESSSSETESKPKPESRIQKDPALPAAFSFSKPSQPPVDLPSASSLPKEHQMCSTPLPASRKRDNSSEDEDDTDKAKGGDEEEDVEDMSEEEPGGDGGGPEATAAPPEEEEFKEKKRDFLSELGLEKDEEEEDSWDSESHSENSNTPHKEEQRLQALDQETSSTGAQEPGKSRHEKNVEETFDEDVPKQKGNGKANWQPLNVLRKLEIDQKKDLMEELGLGEFDDFEDSSDWDSTSTASKTALSAQGMASAGPRDPGASSPAPDDSLPAAEMTPQRSSEKRRPNTPSKSGPQPQPRARKRLLLKPDSEQESDWESDKGTSSSQASSPDRNKDQPVTAVKHSSSGDEEKTTDTKATREFRENLQKADTDTVLAKAKLQESNASCEADGKPSEEKPESPDLSGEAEEADEEQHPVAPSRLQSAEQQKSKNPEEMEMAEDFDELTQSSDTATDDIDSSGYHHASLLVQKLDSATLDPTSIAKLQNIFHEYERSIQKVRSRHGYLSDKVNQLDAERAELKNSLEEVKDAKSALERNQLELQTEVTNLKFQLKQEQENRRNSEIMYNTTRDKLRRTEEQHQLDLQDKQQVELTLRNLELEMRTLISDMKRLEEEHSETQRLLTQERSARTLQENLLNGHLRRQQEMEEENKRSMSRSNEALSQLTEASDRERELLQQISALQAQLTVLRTDLDRSQSNGNLRENQLQEENEALKEKLEDVQRDLKLSNEAVTQTIYSCNNQLTVLKSELTKTANRLESERQVRESLEAEVESTRSRLTGALKEVDLRLAAHSEAEKALLREKEEHQRLKDKLKGEAASQRDAVGSLSQKLAKAEAHENSLENELHRVTLQLTEKSLLLDVLQREKEQAAARVKELEAALQAERESGSRAAARQEAAQERLAQAQSDAMLLRQQLEEAQNKGSAKERAVTDAQERFSDILSKLRSDCEERVQLVEDRNKELASKAADLCDKIYKLEEEKSDRETNLRQLQQELADSLKKLSMSEASLEVNTRYRSDLEEEKTRLLRDLDRLKAKLEESEDQFVQAERRVHNLKSSLNEKEQELGTTAQKLQEALSSSAATALTIKQLEEALQKLEIENAKLEAAAKQQTSKIEALQKEAEEAVKLTDCSPGGGVRGHLEGLVTNLQTSKMTLEEQLSKEVQKQSLMSHTAQDSQALWEEELKSRSKLGLRLAELEKEKGELSAQMEVEKKKVKKVSEQKKAVDTRLDQEMKRNAELQKEMYRLRTLLKTAKKKLRDQDMGAAEFLSPSSSLRMEHGRHSQADGRVQDRVEDLQVQLQREASRCNQLERMNGELKNQVESLRSTSHHSEQLERSKHQLEEEVLNLRRRMEATQAEHSQVEQLRRDAEERIRQEVQHKLEQVNLFLQTHAASQEALDQIRAANEASLRSQLEQKIRELEAELGRARNSQQDSLTQRDSTRSELERFKQLHSEELRLRKSLSAKLERANSRLAEANSKLLNERSRSLISSNMANGSLLGPPLDLSSLASPANYGQLNRNASLGLSLLNPAPDGQRSGVDDYLAKMLGELDRSISKELGKANTELDAACTRMSSVGSASRGELDPLSRATQEYLEVLKKNRSL